MKMTETCKTCRKKFDSGIWVDPQFRDEKVLLFCSEECKKEYLKKKLSRIKTEYPKYYDKIMKPSRDAGENPFWIPQNSNNFDSRQKSEQLENPFWVKKKD